MVATRRNTRELPAYVAFVVPKAAEDAEGGLEMPGREALMALLDLRDGKGLLGHKDSEGTRESGGNKDPEGIQGSREIRGLPGRMARRALTAFRVAEDAEGAGDVKDAEEIQEKVALLERMAHRELMELQAPKDLEDLTELRAHRGSVGTHGRPSVEGRLEL